MKRPDDNHEPTWLQSVLDRYERPLVRYAERLTGNLDLARDVVQDTFIRLCRRDRAGLDGHEAQWLFTVCRNRALDVRRKERRMRTLTEVEAETHESPTPDPADVAEHRQTTALVLGLLADLPPNQQEVIRLKFQAGLSYKEIAHVTKLTVSNVGFLIHTAIKTIRRQLSAESDPAPSTGRRPS